MNATLIFALALGAPPPERIALVPGRACGDKASSADVVVCGQPDSGDRYRIRPDHAHSSLETRASIRLSDGVSAAAETENAEVGGRPSNRIMARLKIKF